MGRPRGSRNADYEQKRRRLARKVVQHLSAAPAQHLSLRELARAAGVSVSTMRHYFGDRSGIIEAGMQEMAAAANRPLTEIGNAARVGTDPVERTVGALEAVTHAWGRDHLGRANAVGLTEGLYADVGPAAAQHLFEPLLNRLEKALADVVPMANLRHAALTLLGPIWLVLTVQEGLGEREREPVDLDAFVREHATRFIQGWSS